MHSVEIFMKLSKAFTLRLLFSLSFFLFASHLSANQELYQQQCSSCHGLNAEGNLALKAPKLAGQDAWYLKNQLTSFKLAYRGKAEGDVMGASMAAIATNLNDTQIETLSAYLANLTSTAAGQGQVKGNIEKGQQFYQSLCGSCHGPAGKGNQALNSPKLSGLNDWYLVEQIEKFRAGKRGYHANDKLGRQMKMMSSILPDQEAIRDVASYLSAQP